MKAIWKATTPPSTRLASTRVVASSTCDAASEAAPQSPARPKAFSPGWRGSQRGRRRSPARRAATIGTAVMATTPSVVPTASSSLGPRSRSRPAPRPPPWVTAQKAPMVAITATLLATGARAAAAKRRAEWSTAVATAPTT